MRIAFLLSFLRRPVSYIPVETSVPACLCTGGTPGPTICGTDNLVRDLSQGRIVRATLVRSLAFTRFCPKSHIAAVVSKTA